MKNRTRIACTVALMAGVGGLAWWLGQPREPVYESKPLSYWLQTCGNSIATSEEGQKLDQVMASIGTNALPCLLRQLQSKDSALKPKWLATLQWLDDNNAVKSDYSTASARIFQACAGFKRLHGEAMVALPELIKIYEQNISEDSRFGVLSVIGASGPEAKLAVPTLVKWLKPNPKNADVIIALGAIHADPELVVPVLLDHLHDSQINCRQLAARGLGAFGPAAKSAVPALVELLQDKEIPVRSAAWAALLQIDPAAAPKQINVPYPMPRGWPLELK